MSSVKVTFPDGNIKEYQLGISAAEIADSLSRKLSEESLAVELNGRLRELYTPITEDSTIKFITFDDEKGKEIYWHSTSHLMAHAVTQLYPEAKFGVGPAIDAGFYYDIDIDTQLTEDDLSKIEDRMMQIAKENNSYTREELPKEKAIQFFENKGDNYKLEILSGIDDSEIISLYKEGNFTDLCTGPHLPNTGKIKYVKLLNISGSYWRGDEKRQQLQRIYGISFPKKKMLEEHLLMLEEAKKRDHRKLGKQLDLFSIHEEAGAGLIYWHPKGSKVRLEIENFWRDAHVKNGYELVYTPHMGKSWLWETSGHLGHYKENMFSPMQIDEQDYYIKPMNCPFHIMIYNTHKRSYRELPLRWAELGTVYRYEKSGVLHGLLRVRGFTQDDAHIICAQDQIHVEIKRVVEFAQYIWKSFGFENLTYYVSTKPEGSEGYDDIWKKAESSLVDALTELGVPFKVDAGGGAFYAPKIDIKIKDALGREWQMSTVQFDFVLPERFNMTYIGEDGKEHRPFMVHRALLGSLERFFGVLIEHYGGAFPLWLAPVQTAVLPVSQNFLEYAKKVTESLAEKGIRAELDERNEKIGYKIRDWETKKVPYMVVVGAKEVEANTVSVRKHKIGDEGSLPLSDFIVKIESEIINKI